MAEAKSARLSGTLAPEANGPGGAEVSGASAIEIMGAAVALGTRTSRAAALALSRFPGITTPSPPAKSVTEPATTRGATPAPPVPSQRAEDGSRPVRVLSIELTSDALPKSARLLSFSGEEKLSHLYRFELHLKIPGDEGLFLDLDEAAGSRATLQLLDEERKPKSVIHGMLSELELVEARDEASLYRAVLVPSLWRLGQGCHSRIFVDQKFPHILEKVLKHAGLTSEDYELRLLGSYAKLELVCQYKESDFAFVSRWMEREGIYYFFEQGELKEKLIVVDQLSTHAKLHCGPKRYLPKRGEDASLEESFRTFRWTRSMQPYSVRVSDYNYLTPDFPLSHEEKASSGAQGAVVSVFGENVVREPEAKRLAQLRAEGIKAQQTIYRGEGRLYDLRPGYRFTVDEHPKLDLRKELLVTCVEYRGAQLEPGDDRFGERPVSRGGPADYRVVVSAIPAELQYRPPCSTPTPRIDGLESAVAAGPATDEYAQLDMYGRCHVKVRFDESDLTDDQPLARVRMLRPHDDSMERLHSPLRKGTEVMLAFLGGHPDRPVIVGVGANPCALWQMSPCAAQDASLLGDRSRLVLDETKGQQSIDLECPLESSALHLGALGEVHRHHLELTTNGAGQIRAGAALDLLAGQTGEGDLKVVSMNGKHEYVGADLTEEYHGSQTTHVHQKRSETIDGRAEQRFNTGLTQLVKDGGVIRKVTGGEVEIIAGGRARTIEGDSTEAISGSLVQTVERGVRISTPDKFTLDAASGITIQSSRDIELVAPNLKKTTLGLLGEFARRKQSTTIYQQSFTGISVSATGFGVSLTGVRFDRTGFLNKNRAREFDWCGFKDRGSGASLTAVRIAIFV